MEIFQNEIAQLRQQIAAQQKMINQQQSHIAQQAQQANTGAPDANLLILFFWVNVFISEKGLYNDCAVFYPYQHKHCGML